MGKHTFTTRPDPRIIEAGEHVREAAKEALKELGVKDNSATKAADPLPMPEPLPDPHGVRFSDEELNALTDTNNEDAVKLAMGTATPEKRKLLGAKQVKPE